MSRAPAPSPPAPAPDPVAVAVAVPAPRWWLVLGWLMPAIGYAALIFWLSSQPNPLPPLTSRVSDKVLHLVEYAVFAVVASWGLSHLMTLASAGRWAAVIGSLYGATDEFHQRFVPRRSAEVADWAVDTVGAAVGALVAWLVLRRWRARASIAR